jgi:hypothetical protein
MTSFLVRLTANGLEERGRRPDAAIAAAENIVYFDEKIRRSYLRLQLIAWFQMWVIVGLGALALVVIFASPLGSRLTFIEFLISGIPIIIMGGVASVRAQAIRLLQSRIKKLTTGKSATYVHAERLAAVATLPSQAFD